MEERYYRNGTVHWVKTTDLNNAEISTTEDRVTAASLNETCLTVHEVGTVLIAMYGGFRQIGRTGLLRVPAAVNQAITAVKPAPDFLVPEFLMAFLNYHVGYWKAVASSSRKDPNITSLEIKALPVAYPDCAEQTAIAAALSDMDAEIAALEARRDKTRALKQGMMQELLTGRTRLI